MYEQFSNLFAGHVRVRSAAPAQERQPQHQEQPRSYLSHALLRVGQRQHIQVHLYLSNIGFPCTDFLRKQLSKYRKIHD